MRTFARAAAFALGLTLLGGVPRPSSLPAARAQSAPTPGVAGPAAPTPGLGGPTPPNAAAGRILGAARAQVAWLNLDAPRPTLLTQLAKPAYPADVAATPGVPFAVASIVGAFRGPPSGSMGGDLIWLDLATGAAHTLLARQSDAESLDLPSIWPDGRAILYQRSNLHAQIPMPGQAQPQYESRVEQIGPDGRDVVPLLENARYPAAAPDGAHFAFVRSGETGSGLYVHSLADDSDAVLVPPGEFLALAYPRFSPDGSRVAFAAISLLSPLGSADGLADWFSPRTALAHGFPWEAWIVNADGTDMHQIQDVIDDDPSVAWSPDGTQLLVFGGSGSFLVDPVSGDARSLTYVAGYGSVGWLPD